MDQIREPAANQQGQKNKQASKLGLKAARLEEELAPVGHGGRIGLENIGPFVITAAGQTGKTLIVQDLPDGGTAQGRQILFAHGEDKFTGRVLFGLGVGAGLEIVEELAFGSAEVVGQDAEGTGRVAKAHGDLVSGGAVDEVGAEGFILALGGGSGFEEEAHLVS